MACFLELPGLADLTGDEDPTGLDADLVAEMIADEVRALEAAREWAWSDSPAGRFQSSLARLEAFARNPHQFIENDYDPKFALVHLSADAVDVWSYLPLNRHILRSSGRGHLVRAYNALEHMWSPLHDNREVAGVVEAAVCAVRNVVHLVRLLLKEAAGAATYNRAIRRHGINLTPAAVYLRPNRTYLAVPADRVPAQPVQSHAPPRPTAAPQKWARVGRQAA
jgi:hypothetical protein